MILQQWPACLECKQPSSKSTGSTFLRLPFSSSGPYMSSQAGIGGLYWIFPLPGCFWNIYRLLAAIQATWQETSKCVRGWIKKSLFLFPLSFHLMPPTLLHSVIAIHLFCLIFSCILPPSLLNQLFAKLTKSSLFNHSVNESICTISVIILLVPLWTFLLLLWIFLPLLYSFWAAGKQNYCDVLHFKFFSIGLLDLVFDIRKLSF